MFSGNREWQRRGESLLPVFFRISTDPNNPYRLDVTPAQKYALFRLTSVMVLMVALMIGYSTLSAR